MDSFDQALSQMDLDFFGSGQHSISPDKAAKLILDNKAFFLDVRCPEESALVAFPFALNIPVNELPDRLAELPKDKLIIVFCSTIFRGALVYGYLLQKGFEQVKALAAPMERLTECLKPHPLYQNKQSA